jgi:hypothetical protein
VVALAALPVYVLVDFETEAFAVDVVVRAAVVAFGCSVLAEADAAEDNAADGLGVIALDGASGAGRCRPQLRDISFWLSYGLPAAGTATCGLTAPCAPTPLAAEETFTIRSRPMVAAVANDARVRTEPDIYLTPP